MSMRFLHTSIFNIQPHSHTKKDYNGYKFSGWASFSQDRKVNPQYECETGNGVDSLAFNSVVFE